MSRISEIIRDIVKNGQIIEKSSDVDKQLAEIYENHSNQLDEVILLTLKNI